MKSSLVAHIKSLLLFCFLSSVPAFAVAKAGTPTQLPDWMKFSLSVPTVLSDIYRNSLAESVFIRVKGTGFFPPVQMLSRKVEANSEVADHRIAKEILQSLGVDTTAANTMLMHKEPFKAGPNSDLPGYVEVYHSTDKQDTYVSCIAYVKDGEKLRVAYTQALRTSLASCDAQLVSLAKSQYFDK